MEKKKLGISYSLLVVVLFTVVCFLTVYIVVDRKLDENKSCSSINDNVSDNNDSNVDSSFDNNDVNYQDRSVIQSELTRIAKEELYLLGGKKSIDELTNREKLWFVYKNKNDSFGDVGSTFSGKEISDFYNDTSISDSGLFLDDIYYSNSNCVIAKYYGEDNYYENENCGFSYDYVDVAFADVSDYIVVDGVYKVSVKYIWFMNEPASGFYIYGSYDQAKNSDHSATNSLYYEPVDLRNSDLLVELVKSDNIERYNYSFNIVDGKYKLIDFYID